MISWREEDYWKRIWTWATWLTPGSCPSSPRLQSQRKPVKPNHSSIKFHLDKSFWSMCNLIIHLLYMEKPVSMFAINWEKILLTLLFRFFWCFQISICRGYDNEVGLFLWSILLIDLILTTERRYNKGTSIVIIRPLDNIPPNLIIQRRNHYLSGQHSRTFWKSGLCLTDFSRLPYLRLGFNYCF